MAKLKQLKNLLDEVIYPITKEKGVYDENNVRLDTKLNSINSEIVNVKGNVTELSQDLSALNNYIGYPDIIGIEVDFENSNFTRLASGIGKTGGTDFDDFPCYQLRRCNLANDGTVNAYYGDSDYKEDGSNGQVMVEIPRFYYRMEPIKLDKAALGYHIRKAKYYISSYKHPGFKLHPAFYNEAGFEIDNLYMSAYEGCLYDTSASAYIIDDAQVMDTTADLLSSIANAKPASGLTQVLSKPNLEILAKNRGKGWHLSTIKAEMALTLLMAIEYNTFEFQSIIGNGVVSKTDDGSTNMSNNTGATTSLGNKTGMASGTNGLVSVSYRGIENPYGNIWKHINGVNIWGNGSMQGGQPYIASDFAFDESKNSDNYTGVGFYLPNSNSYIKAFGYGTEEFDWLFLPSEVGGTSAMPVGDYVWVTANLNGYRVARLGACWFSGLYAGRSCWTCNGGVGARGRSISGRLVYFRQ